MEPDLKAKLLALLDEVEEASPEHPDLDELLRYHAGDLAAEAADRVQGHVASCRTCARQLLDLQAFHDAASATADDLGDFETAAAWRSMKALLRERKPSPATTAPRRLPLALAASLCAVSVALGLWSADLRRQVATLDARLADFSRPHLDVPILYLDPMTRSEGEPVAALEVPDGESIFLFILQPTEPREFSRYRVTVLDAGERLVWEETDLSMSEYGTLRIAFSRDFLNAGRYLVRLYGMEEEQSSLIGEYPVELRYH